METYYVVENNNRYVDIVLSMSLEDKNIKTEVSTTDTVLECDKYNSQEKAQKYADKYNTKHADKYNVKKVTIKVEDI